MTTDSWSRTLITRGMTTDCRSRTSSERREEGVVLLLVLVVIVLTIGSVYAFGRTTLLDVLSTRQRTAHVRAEFLARAGVEIALRTLIDDLFMSDDLLTLALESPDDPWRLLSEVPIEVPGDGTLQITIQDAGSRISLNGLLDADGDPHSDSHPFLVAALERIIEDMPGREEDKPYEVEELAEAILDWLDNDDETRLGDDEADYYGGLGERASPINRPALALDELGAIPDMDDLLLEAIKAYFSPFPLVPSPEESGVNPNTAPPHILGMIYHGTAGDKRLLDRDDVFRILEARDEDKVFCSNDYGEDCESFTALTGFAGETFFPPLQYVSSVFTVRTEARYGTARACVLAVIDRSLAEAPETLYYRMGC